MKTIAIILIAALAAVGCSKKKDGAGGGGACEDTINGALDRMVAARGSNMPAEMKDAMIKVKGAIINRCNQDKWPEEVITCYSKAGSMADMHACRAKLAPELAQKLQADEMAVMQSMMGGAAPGMHGGAMPGGPPPGAAPAPAEPAAPAPPAGSAGSGG